MKNITYVVLAILLGVLTSGCNNEPTPDRSFVSAYYFPDYIGIRNCDSIDVVFGLFGKNVSYGPLYDKLCEDNNDMTYNGFHNASGPVTCLASGLDYMTVVALDDFDSDHPAGSDVSDLVECVFESVAEFINNNYQRFQYDMDESPYIEEYRGYNFVEPSGFYRLKRYKVSEINNENTYMAATYNWLLRFLNYPDSVGEHRFRLSIKTEDKEVIKTFTCDF